MVQLVKNLGFQARMKHIRAKYNFIRELLDEGELILANITGVENPMNMLTKVLVTEKLMLCCTSVGLLR